MISVVIPVLNEAENVAPLTAEILAASAHFPLTEIIFVDDGSTDATPAILADLVRTHDKVRVLRHALRQGQSAATWTGVYHARGTHIVTLDGDGQNDPADIPSVYNALLQAQAKATAPVMVAGQRIKREDNWVRILSSRIANNARRALLQDGVRDTGCSLKLMPRDVFLRLPRFNHMHRFLAALMLREGVAIHLVDVSHRPRLRGVSKYGLWNRLWVGIVDICGVAWLQARPLPAPELTVIQE